MSKRFCYELSRAGINFYLYARAARQFGAFHVCLEWPGTLHCFAASTISARRVPMADFRVLFEGLGFRDVRTLLNSGNVVFSAPNKGRGEVRARIEKGLAAKLGLTSPVIVLSGQEVAAGRA
jgi:Protein of unknown function (DUF1697)